uniref:Uncharacterized protein n=1 Tax=Physcomitrium patens TaxID=3218 RepID=A0A2K1KZV0_PHYPA|nr:hypothetical protein PHYPA_002097 [Physcomitrium patens]
MDKGEVKRNKCAVVAGGVHNGVVQRQSHFDRLCYVCFLVVLRGKQRCSHPVCVRSKERRLVCPSIVLGSCNVKCGVAKAVRRLMLESGYFPIG